MFTTQTRQHWNDSGSCDSALDPACPLEHIGKKKIVLSLRCKLTIIFFLLCLACYKIVRFKHPPCHRIIQLPQVQKNATSMLHLCIEWGEGRGGEDIRIYIWNILNWKRPTRSLKSSSWLHTGTPQNQTMSETIVQMLLDLQQAWCHNHFPEKTVPVPDHLRG